MSRVVRKIELESTEGLTREELKTKLRNEMKRKRNRIVIPTTRAKQMYKEDLKAARMEHEVNQGEKKDVKKSSYCMHTMNHK